MGRKSATRRRKNLVCWTQHLKRLLNAKGNFDPIKCMKRNILNQRDVNSGYTLVHALSSSVVPVAILRELFDELHEQRLMGKLVAKDRDGDMPIQSAIYSGANYRTIHCLLNYDPSKKATMLENRNKANRSALESSLYLESTEVFKLLLEQCIRCKVLKHFTCVEVATNAKGTTTLLHHCVRERKNPHIRAYFDVCWEKLQAKTHLCMTDEEGYTPWYYLLQYSKDEMPRVKEVLGILKEYKIDVATLVVNRNKETLLHKAYRYNKVELIKLLEEICGRVVTDRFKRTPSDRKRILFHVPDPNTEPPHTSAQPLQPSCTPVQPSIHRPRTPTQPPQPSPHTPVHRPTQPPQSSCAPVHQPTQPPQSSCIPVQPPHTPAHLPRTPAQPPQPSLTPVHPHRTPAQPPRTSPQPPQPLCTPAQPPRTSPQPPQPLCTHAKPAQPPQTLCTPAQPPQPPSSPANPSQPLCTPSKPAQPPHKPAHQLQPPCKLAQAPYTPPHIPVQPPQPPYAPTQPVPIPRHGTIFPDAIPVYSAHSEPHCEWVTDTPTPIPGPHNLPIHFTYYNNQLSNSSDDYNGHVWPFRSINTV